MTVQGNLFEKEITEEDRVKDFLKSVFATIERTWSFDLMDEVYTEYRILREMEEEAGGEIELEDDF